MDISKSIDFLLENAGDVIKYRLHKEILGDLSKTKEENLLERVMATPYYKLLESYQKPNGYIGISMHALEKLKETPLQDGEAAARLISNYAIPKTVPLVQKFAEALVNDSILEHEFSYNIPEIRRFQNRKIGTQSGFSLQLLIDTCLALMGFGDEYDIRQTVKISYSAFVSLLSIESLDEIIKCNPKKKSKYNYPYVEANTLLPCIYHLQILSHTFHWRNAETLKTLARALNHQCKIMKDGNNIHTKIGSTYYVPCRALVNPIKHFEPDRKDICYRRCLTDIVKIGIGKQVDVTKKSVENLMEQLKTDGILRMKFTNSYEKQYYKRNCRYPTPYSEVGLEKDYKSDTQLWCDLTFWAVQFLHYYNA